METAKVDIRKLQLLNDRINQCIDALNQVRLSVHGLAQAQGLSHSGVSPFPQSAVSAIPQYGVGYPSLGATPFTGAPNLGAFANPAFGQGSFPQGFVPGLSHTSGIGFGALGAFGQQGFNPLAVSPETLEAGRPIWADPILTARI